MINKIMRFILEMVVYAVRVIIITVMINWIMEKIESLWLRREFKNKNIMKGGN